MQARRAEWSDPQNHAEEARQASVFSAAGGAAAAPVVDLARGDAGQPGEPGLGDVGAGEQNGKFGVQQGPHSALYIELSSIEKACFAVRKAIYTR
jgi:hypothetical protein